MAGRKNLNPPIRSAEEAREKGHKGGIASGEARREKRTIRKRLELLLSMQAEGEFKGDNAEAMCAALLKKALNGDVSAFTVIRDSVGEKPTDKLTHSGPDGAPIQIEHGISSEILEFIQGLQD